MVISENFVKLRSCLDQILPLSGPKSFKELDPKDSKFNLPFASRNHIEVLSASPGYIKASQEAKKPMALNSHGFIHGAFSMIGTDSIMAAAAQSEIKDPNKIAVIRDFAQRFHEPVFPGDKLSISAEVSGSEKTNNGQEIKYLNCKIKRDNDNKVVAEAQGSYFTTDKDTLLANAA